MANKNHIIGPFREVFLNPRDNSIVFSLHRKLLKGKVNLTGLQSLPLEKKLYVLYTHAPVVHHRKGTNNYIVITNRPIYDTIDQDNTLPGRFLEFDRESLTDHLIAAGIIEDKESITDKDLDKRIEALIESLQKADAANAKHINTLIQLWSNHSPSTDSRTLKKQAHQNCAGCTKGMILAPRNNVPIDPEAPIKTYKCACSYHGTSKRIPKHATPEEIRNVQKRCDFYIIFTEYEFKERYLKGSPISFFIEEVVGQRCPKDGCGGRIFIRTIHHSEDKIEKVVYCQYNGFSFTKNCDYKEDLKLWTPRLPF